MMEKKIIYYIIGGIAILGIGYYLMNKGKKTTNDKEIDSDSMALDSMTLDKKSVNKSKLTKTPVKIYTSSDIAKAKMAEIKKLTPQELESELAVCGKKPRLKKNKKKYEQCRSNIMDKLKGEGLVAFDGSYVIDESVVGNGFYSNFDNGLDLDL